jgi:hypothetical protein
MAIRIWRAASVVTSSRHWLNWTRQSPAGVERAIGRLALFFLTFVHEVQASTREPYHARDCHNCNRMAMTDSASTPKNKRGFAANATAAEMMASRSSPFLTVSTSRPPRISAVAQSLLNFGAVVVLNAVCSLEAHFTAWPSAIRGPLGAQDELLLAATAQNPMRTYTPHLLRECRDAVLLKVAMPEYTPKLDRTVASTPESRRGTDY